MRTVRPGGLRSIRARLTVWYLLVLTVVLLLFGGASYIALGIILTNNTDDLLQNTAFVIADSGDALEPSPADRQSGQRSSIADTREGEHFWRTVGLDGAVISGSPPEFTFGLTVDPGVVASAATGTDSFRTVQAEGEQVRVYTTALHDDTGAIGVLQVGVQLDTLSRTLSAFRWAMFVLIPVVILIASSGGLILVDRMLRPVERITETANRISAGDLGLRVGGNLPDDELGRLARTFDTMLARLHASFEQQKRFVADASHELRTPLTVLMGEVTLTLSRRRSAEQYRRTLEDVAAEIDVLSRLSNQLLELAMLERRPVDEAGDQWEAAHLLRDLASRFRPVAEEKGLYLRDDGVASAPIGIDPEAVRRIVTILLDNAIDFTDSGGIELSARSESGATHISVADTGLGIPANAADRIFDRFYRVDPSRPRDRGGSGLGLSIARELARSIGASLEVSSTTGVGSIFTLVVPC